MMSWENPWGASRDVLYRIRTLPTYLTWSAIGFVSGWVQTRHILNLFIGIPSLLIASLVIATTLQTRAGLTSETIRRYIETAQQLLKNDQIEEAEFYMSRLKSLEYQTDLLLSTRAEIETRRDREDLAEICYRQMLGNEDHALDTLAHQKLAFIELKAIQSPDSPHTQEAIHHFEQALLANPDDLVGQELLAKLFLSSGDLNSAVQHLGPVAEQKPAVQLELARIFHQLDRQVMKTEAAAKAEKYFSDEVAKLGTSPAREGEPEAAKTQPTKLFLNWIEALILQKKLDDAIKVGTEAVDRHNSPDLRRLLASIYLMKANAIPPSDIAWAKRWELVALSRNYDPSTQESLVILSNIAANAPAKLRQLAMQEILPYMENGQAPPSAYYQVGTAAAEEQDWATAEKLLRKSVEIDPKADVGWNNLAHTLLSRTQPDLVEAERCVNEALRLNSAPPRYHQTRGQIMLSLQKWSEAARELETARSGLPPLPEIHKGLAEAYSQLGDEDLAAFHQVRYEALIR